MELYFPLNNVFCSPSVVSVVECVSVTSHFSSASMGCAQQHLNAMGLHTTGLMEL